LQGRLQEEAFYQEAFNQKGQVMAKELSPKQKKIAAMGGNPKKIDSADFAALRKGKKMSTAKNPKVITNRKKGM